MQGGSRREATRGFIEFQLVHERQRVLSEIERGLTMNEFGFWKCFFAVLLANMLWGIVASIINLHLTHNLAFSKAVVAILGLG